MKEVICNIDLFGDQRIWIRDHNNKLIQIGKYSLESTEDNLLKIIKKENCNRVVLIGGPKDFSETFALKIKEKSISEYGFKNIEIEIREK